MTVAIDAGAHRRALQTIAAMWRLGLRWETRLANIAVLQRTGISYAREHAARDPSRCCSDRDHSVQADTAAIAGALTFGWGTDQIWRNRGQGMGRMILAQLVITPEGIAQGAFLASILAGFAFSGATSVQDRGTVVLYFAAGMLMLLSTWAGLLALITERAEPETALASAFFLALGLGSLAFVLATIRHVRLLHPATTAAWCLGIALAVAVAGILLVVLVLHR